MTPEALPAGAFRGRSRLALLDLCAAQEREIARLRNLLDEIHRGDADAPSKPKRYDAATLPPEDAA